MKSIHETNIMLDELKASLIELRPVIDKKEWETQVMLVNLEKQQKVAAEKEKITSVEEAES